MTTMMTTTTTTMRTMTEARKRKAPRFRWSRVGTGAAAVGLFALFWGAIAATAEPGGGPSSGAGVTVRDVVVIDRRLIEQLDGKVPTVRIVDQVATEPAKSGQKARKSRAS